MNILAIETATITCAVGLRLSSGEEFGVVLDAERQHTETLMRGVADLLSSVGLSAKRLDRIVVDRGPGLYTGLRVGVATAIGLSIGANAELVSVTSLEVLAHDAQRGGVRGLLVAAVDGRRGELFIQRFSLNETVTALEEPAVTTPIALATELDDRGEAVSLAGDGVARYESEFSKIEAATLLVDYATPSALVAVELGAARPPEESVAPMYLRDADAVANFTTRQRQ
ncbi:MAG: tRNA (adenosine(37)-N6)-threonylcarbamoyltransferase complex dimerization subunit type 1 TsaB [Acidimicrobiales bacterium]